MKNSSPWMSVARKMLTWEALVILIFIAPVAIFAASTIGKSVDTNPALKAGGPGSGATQTIFLTVNPGVGNQTWNVPADWTSVNTIECIGAGGDGDNIGAGGGGAYAKITNLSLTPSGTVTYSVGGHASTTDSVLQETYFNGTESATASLFCEFGLPAITTSGGAGGSADTSIGTTKNAGGAGGNGGAGGASGGGGGGAAGPTGVGGDGCHGGGGGTGTGAGGGGANGGASCSFSSNGANGNGGIGGGAFGNPAESGTPGTGGGGGGGEFPSCGGYGAIDMAFDATHGAGGGGGGNSGGVSTCGGSGGTYGGGAGGGTTPYFYGLGGQGIIVITYTPVATEGGSGLVGWWSFDGPDMTSNVADKSGQGNNGFLSGFTSTTTVSGPIGQALYFNGATQYALVSGSTVYADTGSPFSASLWVKLEGFDGTEYGEVLALKSSLSSTYDIFLSNDSGGGYLGLNIGANSTFSRLKTSSAWPAGVWKHVVVTYNGQGAGTDANYAVYIDGSSQSLSASGTFGTNSNQTMIGGTNDGTVENLRGGVDDVRIYDKALTANEIKRLYGLGATTHISVSPKTGLAAPLAASGASNGLTGWWTFDGPDMLQNVADKSGSGNNGFLTVNFPATSTVVTRGKLGQALGFDTNGGGNHGISFAGIVTGTTYTYATWVKPDSQVTSYGTLFSDSGGGTGVYYRGSNAGASARKINFFYSSTDHQNNTQLANGAWNHVAVVVNGGNVTFYLNGVSDGTASAAGNFTATSMGKEGAGDPLTASLDDVRFYNRALSATEVAKLYGVGATTHVAVSPTTGLAAPAAASGASNGLVAWWTFDGPDLLQNATDKSGTGNKGMLIGFTSTTTVLGKSGQALNFPGGSGTYVSVPYSASLAPTVAVSYGAWFKTSDKSAVQEIISKTEAGGYSLTLNDGSSGNLAAFVRVENTYYSPQYATSNLSNNTWYHGFVVYDGTAVRLYLNGVQVDSTPITGAITYDNNNTLCIGQEPGANTCSDGNGFLGPIDDVRVYNRALTAPEVQRLYDTGR